MREHPAPLTADHEHAWQQVGICRHYHRSGFNDHRAYQCEDCGQYAHSPRPVSFGCGRRPRTGPLPEPQCPLEGDAAAWAAWYAEYETSRAHAMQEAAKRRAAREAAHE